MLLGTVILRNDDRRTRCESRKESDQQVDKGTCRAADRRQRFLADKITDNHSIGCIV